MQYSNLIEKGIAGLFEEQADRTPDKAVLLCEDSAITLSALNARANKIARFLRRRGVEREQPVVVLLPRSPRLVETLLGILKAGGAYVVLNRHQPLENLIRAIEELKPFVLTEAVRVESLKRHSTVVCSVTDADIDDEPADNLDITCLPDQLASIVYTSGSTGIPKGVSIPMRAIVNRLAMMWSQYPHEPDDVVLIHRSCSIIGSSWDLFGPLLKGVPSVIVPEANVDDPVGMWDAIVKHKISHLAAAPALWHWLVERAEARPGTWTSLRLGIIGGDMARASLVGRWKRSFSPATLINVYGATECVCPVAADLAKTECRSDPVPIGVPVTNVEARVLDSNLDRVGDGDAGELYISGACLSRGYFHDAALTAARFVPNPYAGTQGDILYRTGDLARWHTDGQLELIGRSDHQIKVKGSKVDMAAVEGEIERCCGSGRAVVIPSSDRHGQTTLIAYLEGATGLVSLQRLRALLLRSLPESSVPCRFFMVQQLPLTANGKVDRQALLSSIHEAHCDLPGWYSNASQTEQVLFDIWNETLKETPDQLDANFFDLGGDSLTAMRAVSRIDERLGIRIQMRELFDNPTIRLLARAVQQKKMGAATVARTEAPLAAAGDLESSERTLSFNQEGRLYADFLAERMGKSARSAHVVLQLWLKGPVRYEALHAAFKEMTERHEVLRTGFTREIVPNTSRTGFNTAPFISNSVSADIQHTDFTNLSREDQLAQFRERLVEETNRPFDRRAPPLMRVLLFRLAEDSHILLVIFDHLISDGYSLQIVRDELELLYANALGSSRHLLPAIGARYVDFAAWQRRRLTGTVLSDLASYWKLEWSKWRDDMLRTEDLSPFDDERARSRQQLWAEKVTLSETATAAVRKFARRNSATLHVTCLAALCITLHALSGRRRVAVMAHYANRQASEFEKVLGWFANSHPLGFDFSDNPRLEEVVGEMREAVIKSYEREELPFMPLLQDLMLTDRTSPAFSQTLISVDFRTESKTQSGALTITPTNFRIGETPLQLLGIDRGPRLTLLARYSAGMCSARLMRRLLACSRDTLAMIAMDSRLRVFSCVSILEQTRPPTLAHAETA